MPQTITKSWVFLLFLLLSLLSRNDKCCYGLEASFTPASGDNGGGPLPLSQNQRNELLQLEQAITSSPNPQETLAHVASQNGMSADELYNLLVRNRQDMEMAGGGGGGAGGQTEAMKRHAGSSLPRKILGLFYGIIGIMIRYAQKHPRGFGMFMAVLLSVLYYIIMAPRTGLVLSTSTNLLSNGHTTLLAPPTQYLTNYLSSLQAEDSLPMGTKAGFSHKYISFMEKEMEEEEDDTIVLMNKLPKKSNVATIFTGQKFIPSNIIMPPSSKNDNSNDEDTLKQTMASHLIFNAASQIFTTKRFSEFKPPDASSVAQSLRFHTKNDAALLVLKQMGNYRRFGIQPLQLTHEEYDDNRECMVFSTLTGGHFDGELCVWITKNDDDDEEEEEKGIMIHIALIIPKNGRKPSKKITNTLLSTLLHSVSASTILQAKQTYARQSQSKLFHSAAKTRATEKRSLKYDLQKKQEEMAKDRRRKWQRQNKDAGHYRPSGARMRSPNNAHFF